MTPPKLPWASDVRTIRMAPVPRSTPPESTTKATFSAVANPRPTAVP